MDKWLSVIQVITPIFAAVFLGVLARRRNILSTEDNHGLQQFVMKFGMPCVLFNSTLTASLGAEAITSMAMLVPFLLLSSLGAFQVRRKLLPLHNLPMLFSGQEGGMLGIPLYLTLFGAAHAFRLGVLDMTQLLIAVPVISLLSADPGESPTPLAIAGKVFQSPMLLMSLLGLVLNLSGAAAWLESVSLLPLVTGITEFLGQPVSAVMLFSVGYSFSLSRDNRGVILKLCAAHLAVFGVMCLAIQGILFLLPQVDPATRWAVLMYATLPPSYLAPSLARTPREATIASGVCSMLTIFNLAVFCLMAVFVA